MTSLGYQYISNVASQGWAEVFYLWNPPAGTETVTYSVSDPKAPANQNYISGNTVSYNNVASMGSLATSYSVGFMSTESLTISGGVPGAIAVAGFIQEVSLPVGLNGQRWIASGAGWGMAIADASPVASSSVTFSSLITGGKQVPGRSDLDSWATVGVMLYPIPTSTTATVGLSASGQLSVAGQQPVIIPNPMVGPMAMRKAYRRRPQAQANILGLPYGSTSGGYTFTSTASGSKTENGSGSGTYSWASTASGVKDERASGSGRYGWAATATGTSLRKGSSATTYGWAASATGHRISAGAAAPGTYTWVTAASGQRIPLAATATRYGWAASAIGYQGLAIAAADEDHMLVVAPETRVLVVTPENRVLLVAPENRILIV